MRIHPRSILWPTDFSRLSLIGAKYAKVLCDVFSARLHVIHVAPVLVSSNASVPMMTGGDVLVTTTDTVTAAKVALGRLVAREFGKTAKIEQSVFSGNAWDEICRYAKNRQIDMIIIATHGATGLRRLLMGSTAERVVQHAPCPVLTVKSFGTKPPRSRC